MNPLEVVIEIVGEPFIGAFRYELFELYGLF
jgi:hypothetical protein